MSLVKVGASTVLGQVIGIWKNRLRTVRRIVEGVTVGVRNAKRKRALGSTESNLDGVIIGISNVLEGKDLAEARGDHTARLTQGIRYRNSRVESRTRGSNAIKHRRSRRKNLTIDREGPRIVQLAETG